MLATYAKRYLKNNAFNESMSSLVTEAVRSFAESKKQITSLSMVYCINTNKDPCPICFNKITTFFTDLKVNMYRALLKDKAGRINIIPIASSQYAYEFDGMADYLENSSSCVNSGAGGLKIWFNRLRLPDTRVSDVHSDNENVLPRSTVYLDDSDDDETVTGSNTDDK